MHSYKKTYKLRYTNTQKLYLYPIVYNSYLVTRAFYDSARVRDPRNQSLRINPKETRLKLNVRSDSSNDDCLYPLSASMLRALFRALSTGAASYNNNLRANIAASWIQSKHSQTRQVDIYQSTHLAVCLVFWQYQKEQIRNKSSCLSSVVELDLH